MCLHGWTISGLDVPMVKMSGSSALTTVSAAVLVHSRSMMMVKAKAASHIERAEGQSTQGTASRRVNNRAWRTCGADALTTGQRALELEGTGRPHSAASLITARRQNGSTKRRLGATAPGAGGRRAAGSIDSTSACQIDPTDAGWRAAPTGWPFSKPPSPIQAGAGSWGWV